MCITEEGLKMYDRNFDGWQKRHLTNLIAWLYDEVKSAGGDGDALWYSRYFYVKDIFPLVQEFNSGHKYPWQLALSDDRIDWWNGQESILITNNEELYKNAPSWQQVLLKY